MEMTRVIPTTSLKRSLLSQLPMRTAPSIQTENNNAEFQLPPKRRRRTAISTEQLLKLEALHEREQWPSRAAKEALATEINTSTHFVNVWFQNKRSRVRRALQEESELAAIKIKEHLTSPTKMIRKYRGIPIAPKPSGPIYPTRSSSMGIALPLGGLCRTVDSSNQFIKGSLVQAPSHSFPKIVKKYRNSYSASPISIINQSGLTADETTNNQRTWSDFVTEERSSRHHEHSHRAADVGHTTCVSQANFSTSDERGVLRQEDVCLLQTLLYMMMIAGGHWNLIQDKLHARLAIDACLYGLKLRDGKTLVIDKDYGFGIKEEEDFAVTDSKLPTSQLDK